jgi:cytochrome c55X
MMRGLFPFFSALMMAGVLAAPLPASPGEAGKDVGISPQRARELVHLVRQDCGSCHGLTLRGGLGKPLLPEDLEGRDAEVLAEIILDGIPDTPMPPWRGQLSEAEALWIARRLKEGFPHETP